MATIGVEYIERFANARANAGVSGAQDLTCPYYIAEWFAPTLADGGHQIKFLRSEHAVTERHMRDVSQGGDDAQHADSVDLYLIITHGHYENREVQLLYDIKVDDWIGGSKKWRFGDTCNLEWLMIYGCHSIDGADLLAHLHIFQGLHLFCGAYGDMFDSWTVDEAGQDTADNLLCGKPVSESWTDGVSDWWVSNHAMVISVETQETYRNGDPDWANTVIQDDHLWGEGVTKPDVPPNKQYWMTAVWNDGGIYG
jgi:hypothetical protein